MIKRLACLFILLSFLMIKHSPLFLILEQETIVAYQGEEDQQKEIPEENKGPKQVEFTDEEAINLQFCGFTALTDSLLYFSYTPVELTPVYLSVLNPPPDFLFI